MSSFKRVTSQVALVSGLVLSGLPLANAHYGFPVVLINGIASKWWEFIRWDSEPMVCGWNGTKTGHETGVAKIEAGGIIGFRAFAASYNAGFVPIREFDPSMDGVGHSGPGQAYMSKAPGAIEDYEGDGDWFKIGTSGASNGMNWDSDRKPELNFTIPKATPPGQYLVRVEHFNISPQLGQTQLFVNCAQVEVLGSGEGTPGPTIMLPGYDPKDPGIWLPQAMWNPYKPSELLKKYKGPGPEIWTGE